MGAAFGNVLFYVYITAAEILYATVEWMLLTHILFYADDKSSTWDLARSSCFVPVVVVMVLSGDNCIFFYNCNISFCCNCNIFW